MERRDLDGDPVGDVADAFAQTVAPDTQQGAAAESAPAPAVNPDGTGRRDPPAPAAGSFGARASSARAGSLGANRDPDTTLDHVPGTGEAEVATLPEVDTAHYIADSEVARGGMGRIIAARDRRLGRPVAIKELIQLTDEAMMRFRREALITARLQHPGIIPVYEAGRWPTGEPFYAMKLVAGRPFDKVIAEARTLPDRLALLPRILAATEAIAYAHSHRVIHRDLKPGNILIGEFGETVVIDWGLAKDLDAVEVDDHALPGSRSSANRRATSAAGPVTPRIRPSGPAIRVPKQEAVEQAPAAGSQTSSSPASRGDDSETSTLTLVGSVMGTPAYMAPEQARGETVDERADVFSLGAMLYHVLSGTPPYEAKTATDVISAAALGKVVPLAERAPHVPRDLLAIVSRAMAGEPADRYATAGELAAELHRFLTGQLVDAHRYTPWQRVGRFVRRHRAAVAIAVVATIGFAVGGTMAVRRIVEARDRAEVQRRLAIKHRHAAERLVDFMQTDLTRRLEPIGRLDLLVPLGTEVKAYFEDLAAASGGMRAEDVDRMARALRAIANADDKSGNVDAAIASWNEIKQRLTGLLATAPGDAGAYDRKLILAQTEVDLGRAIYARGKIDEAAALYTGAAHTLAELLIEAPTHRPTLLAAGDAHDLLGDLLRNHGKVDESVEEYTAARLMRDKVARGMDPAQDREAVFALSMSHFKLAAVHYARGETSSALTEYRACARLRDSLAEIDPDNPLWQKGQVEVNTQLAGLQRETGDLPGAIASYQATLAIADGLVHRDPANTEWRRFRGNMLSDFGFALVDKGDFAAALDRFHQARDNHQELVTRDPENASWQVDMSRILTRTGDAHLSLGDYPSALDVLEQARAIRKALVARNPKNDVWKRLLAWSTVKLAQLYGQRKATGDATRALAAQEEALALRTELVAGAPSNAGLKNELASSNINLGRALLRDGGGTASDRVVQLVDAGTALAQALVDGDPVNMEWKETLVSGLFARALAATASNDPAAARAALDPAVTIATGLVAQSPDSTYWRATLAELLDAVATADLAEGKPLDAAAHRKAAFAAIEPVALAGRLPAFRRALYNRLAAYR